MGFAVGPISLLAILDYCNMMGMDGELREEFAWLVQRLDNKYLEWSEKRRGKS